uniref:Protein FAM73B n=1 Tax=Ascaris suum TaxID=6253 RepID=F1L2L8_ASCSU
MPSNPGISLSTHFAIRKTTVIVTSIGVGVVLVGYLLKRYWRKKDDSEEMDHLPNGFLMSSTRHHEFPRSGSRMRRTTTPSLSDRGQRHISLRSANIPPTEIDILSSLDKVQELVRCVERALSGLEFVRNRSEKDRKRLELLSSVLDRLRILESDVNLILIEGGYDKDLLQSTAEEYVTAMWSNATSPRAGTLSVLSDDSFMSAYEDLPVSLDDADVLMRDPLKIELTQMLFYQSGVAAASSGEVINRKCRAEFCACESEVDFKAKVWCIRQAFNVALSDEHNRMWLAQAGRQLIADLLRHARKDPAPFYVAYDSMIQFLMDERNLRTVEEELKQRRVPELGFWDVMVDFVLIDSFEDLSRPPSAVLAVTRNMFLSQSMKESTLTTVIWSMLKAKRARLSLTNGFISHFYDISEVISPVITLGFLGTDEHMRDLCQYFKEQTCSFIVDIFNVNRVRYTGLKELSEDVWMILRTRIEMVQTRLSTELLPVA